jgi:septal ring factor EnvC (AmiA/AmiB activator)
MNLRKTRKGGKKKNNIIKKCKGKLSDIEKQLQQQRKNIEKVEKEIFNFAANKHLPTRRSKRQKKPPNKYDPETYFYKTSKNSKTKKL